VRQKEKYEEDRKREAEKGRRQGEGPQQVDNESFIIAIRQLQEAIKKCRSRPE
jgi:ribosomal protein L19E